ncbi:hypothetical protein [Caproicibacter fermentans]|uniref:Uncharacterized protein n=1 Tax=Caproicibacter fermentans TaxID=2576756 RepID=A0A7G8T6J1_9FIRM|nr:hypothetical protein [Caproicibacter fermentans]QNK39232.1 hypothetical protein HCR03_10650 [Caproicibacter fermentans]
MKKLFSWALVVALALCVSVPSYAQETIISQKAQSTSVTTENLGNGFTVETKTTIFNSATAALVTFSTRSATRTKTYKANGSTVATVTLQASFGYDGSSAWVISKSASHSTVSGWSYGSESLKAYKDTASLSSTLTQWSGVIPIQTVDVDISLTCSPSGTIS